MSNTSKKVTAGSRMLERIANLKPGAFLNVSNYHKTGKATTLQPVKSENGRHRIRTFPELGLASNNAEGFDAAIVDLNQADPDTYPLDLQYEGFGDLEYLGDKVRSAIYVVEDKNSTQVYKDNKTNRAKGRVGQPVNKVLSVAHLRPDGSKIMSVDMPSQFSSLKTVTEVDLGVRPEDAMFSWIYSDNHANFEIIMRALDATRGSQDRSDYMAAAAKFRELYGTDKIKRTNSRVATSPETIAKNLRNKIGEAVERGMLFNVSKLSPQGTGGRIVAKPKEPKSQLGVSLSEFPVVTSNADGYRNLIRWLPEYSGYLDEYLAQYGDARRNRYTPRTGGRQSPRQSPSKVPTPRRTPGGSRNRSRSPSPAARAPLIPSNRRGGASPAAISPSLRRRGTGSSGNSPRLSRNSSTSPGSGTGSRYQLGGSSSGSAGSYTGLRDLYQ